MTLRAVEVLEALPIEDAPPPHLAWDGAGAVARRAPALLLVGAPLVLRVALDDAPGDRYEGRARVGARVVPLTGRRDGAGAVVLDSGDAPLVEALGAWDVALTVTRDGAPLHDRPAPLRVLTVHDRPRTNGHPRGRLPHAGEVHLGHACRWAQGADRNTGAGPGSIAHQVANALRHFVHPGPAYDGLPPPANYHRLPGHDAIRDGERPVSPLYAPPPWMSDETFASHYAENFGWLLLDHPTHPGGRCNQQASALCEVLGTLGLTARVVHLERTALARRGPDLLPAYQGFRVHPQRDAWWDLHALAEVRLDDGTFHYYDVSFSRPDVGQGRLHGTREQMLRARADDPRARLIHEWGPWFYALDRVEVPACFTPTAWEGLPAM